MKTVSWKSKGLFLSFRGKKLLKNFKKFEKLLLVLVSYFLESVQYYMGRAYCSYFTNSVRKEGDAMRRIAINMQNTLFCNAIADTLRRSGNELEPYTIDSPDKVVDECKWITPFALLMEVTGYTPWLLAERMKICDAVKELNIGCKIVLIVDENAEKAVAGQVKQAKKDGLIDQFIYGSISASYLADIVDSL